MKMHILPVLFLLVVNFLYPVTANADWYRAIAKPSLVVRESPSIASQKLGNIPYDGKINVIKKIEKSEFIGGKDGNWVEIKWHDSNAFVFNAYLEEIQSKKQKTNFTTAQDKAHNSTNKAFGFKSYRLGDNYSKYNKNNNLHVRKNLQRDFILVKVQDRTATLVLFLGSV